MKTKSFLAIAILAAFSIASCGSRDKSVTEKLVGVWTGIDTIQIASCQPDKKTGLANISGFTL